MNTPFSIHTPQNVVNRTSSYSMPNIKEPAGPLRRRIVLVRILISSRVLPVLQHGMQRLFRPFLPCLTSRYMWGLQMNTSWPLGTGVVAILGRKTSHMAHRSGALHLSFSALLPRKEKKKKIQVGHGSDFARNVMSN